MRTKSVKPTSPGEHTAQGPPPGRDLDSIRLTNKTTLGALEKPLPVSWVQRLSRAGSLAPGCSWQGVWAPPPWEKKSGIRGWLGAFPLGAPQPSTPSGKNTNSSVGGPGRAGSPNPGGTPRYTRREQGSPQRGQAVGGGRGGGWWRWSGEGRYSDTKATVNTTPRGGRGTGRKSKQSQVVSALGSQLPGSVGLALGSRASLCRAPGGVGEWGRAGGVRVGAGEKGEPTEAPEREATRTTPSWK